MELTLLRRFRSISILSFLLSAFAAQAVPATGEIELENAKTSAGMAVTGTVVSSSVAGVSPGDTVWIWQDDLAAGTSIPANGKVVCKNIQSTLPTSGATHLYPPANETISCEKKKKKKRASEQSETHPN